METGDELVKETENYALKMIELDDSPPDITVINDNWEVIDSHLKDDEIDTTDTTVHMSVEEKAFLDDLLDKGISDLVPVDGSIILVPDPDDGNIKIGVAVSEDDHNLIDNRKDGLFVQMPVLEIEKQDEPTPGSYATYRLKQIIGDDVSYLGNEIEIPLGLSWVDF